MDKYSSQEKSIFLEGPSCSGKTTMMRAVDDQEVALIQKQWPENIGEPTTEFFLERDEDKLRRARNATKPIKVIDRGYLSTLTFYSVLEEVTGVSANPVYRWFISEIGNTLYRPDHYVFVDVPAEVSVERAKKAGRAIADNNMWLKFPDKINYWYKRMFAVFEPAAKVYRIDGTKSQLDVAEEFRSLLEMLKTGNEG